MRFSSPPFFRTKKNKRILGGYSEGVPPVPMPNTEVKPFSADGTATSRGGRVGRCRDYRFCPQLYAGFFFDLFKGVKIKFLKLNNNLILRGLKFTFDPIIN